MRKILAGLMATAMVTSICATASFAAVKNTSAYVTGTVSATVAAPVAYTTLHVAISGDGTIVDAVANIPVNIGSVSLSAIELAKELSGLKFDVVINGVGHVITLKQVGSTAGLTATFDNAAAIPGYTTTASTFNMSLTGATGVVALPLWTADSVKFANVGAGGEIVETEKDGNLTSYKASDVFLSYQDGMPIPLTESGAGVDKDLNGVDGVQSTNTLYFKVRDDDKAALDKLEDEDYFKMKIAKSSNGKYVDTVEDVTKIFASNLFDANSQKEVPGTGDNKRHRYVKVKLKENLTDDEFKITLDVRLTATSKAVDTKIVTNDATMIKVKDFAFYMKNMVKTADNDWRVGINGLMLNPLGNDWNDVTYYDEDTDVAFMRFFGDSDVSKFYAKLSTKWTHADYAAYFNDQDAFYFEFTGSPKMSSTSRADLQIYDPFTDINGNSTFDSATATIYQVIDGDLIDVTDSFTFGEGENGENAFITRTRFIGTYIICEKPVEEAAGTGDVDDMIPDDVIDAGNNTTDAGKGPANTGRYA